MFAQIIPGCVYTRPDSNNSEQLISARRIIIVTAQRLYMRNRFAQTEDGPQQDRTGNGKNGLGVPEEYVLVSIGSCWLRTREDRINRVGPGKPRPGWVG